MRARAGIACPVATRPGSRGDGRLPAPVEKRATDQMPKRRGGNGRGGQGRHAETRPSAIRLEAGERAAMRRPDAG